LSNDFSTKRKGKPEEAKFRSFFNGMRCYIYRIPDFSSGIKRKSPSDFLVVRLGKSYMFEVKSVKGDRFRFDAVKDHQAIALRKHYCDGDGESYVVVFNSKRVYFIGIHVYFKLRDETHLKSIPFSELDIYTQTKEQFFSEVFV
jgi:penicillin-binding protein-related factor A (putative recombinase)